MKEEFLMQKRPKQYLGIQFRTGKSTLDKHGRYVCQINFYPYSNKRVFKTIKLEKKSYREAAKIRAQWMAEYVQRHPCRDLADKSSLPFEALRSVLIQMMRAGTLTHRQEECAQRTINKSLNVFDRFFGEFVRQRHHPAKRVNDLPKGIFLDYRTFISVEKKLIWRNEIQTLKTIISRFWRADYCDDRIYKESRTMPTPKFEMKQRHILTIEEKKKLLGFIKEDNPCYYFITYFLAKLGWRIGETLSIKKENIKWVRGKPVAITIQKEFRKNRREFVLETVDKKLEKVIKECLNDGTNQEAVFLFPNSKGNMIKDDIYRKYLAKVSEVVLGRKVAPHDFRHSLVTLLKNERCPDKDIMGITGHVDRDVLNEYYAHTTADGRSKVLEAAGL